MEPRLGSSGFKLRSLTLRPEKSKSRATRLSCQDFAHIAVALQPFLTSGRPPGRARGRRRGSRDIPNVTPFGSRVTEVGRFRGGVWLSARGLPRRYRVAAF